MSSANNEQLIELVSNAQMAFLNGKLQEAFTYMFKAEDLSKQEIFLLVISLSV